MTQILVPLANGFEEIEAISIIDICRRGGLDVIVAGVDGKTAMGAHNIPIVTDCLITEINANDLEMIVLPGGWNGTVALAKNKTVQSLLKQMQQDDKLIGAICAAPYALNAAGVLSDNYTCYPSIENKIRLEGYSNDQHTIIDGKVMTSQGVGTAACFALEIVKTLQGNDIYQQIKQEILAEC
ncbi:DJ-1/YajL/PfpI superfamily, includes chaperone protein YajL (former ThiJ), parkinsonism-associated protein DJ-1, peptidases PfpI, Hsp31 [hydrothermal vent metagenome]|uniref:DJ-1/YajL/PfpI superfamily, includes chaperone protein YajL (Former ThiJ), parkinsonism-associated protein DJ-1, peptidases PfpI, Hsp31 n=2 Tax=root TaxID=1 RepID=A0A1W1D8W1_9ZZZZ